MRIKKILTVVLASVMALGMATSVFAAGSDEGGHLVYESGKIAADAPAEVAALQSSKDVAAFGKTTGLAVDGKELLDLGDLYAVGKVDFSKAQSFTVPALAGQKGILFYHYSTARKVWEKIDATVSGTTVTATLQDASPLVVLVDKAAAPAPADGNKTETKTTTTSSGKSPKTGATSTAAVWFFAALLLAGASVIVRRRNA